MISLIATVLNEGESMHRLMRSVAAQTRLPDEIVIVDGGSSDNTVAILQTYTDKLPLRVLVEPGCNISEGRNRAIEAAMGDIIAVTDAGVTLAPDWLDKITRPLIDDQACDLVGGFFHADYTNLFELAMSATVLPLREEINPATFLPTSRSVAFRKMVWQAVEGYPEWLDYCEDLIFDLRLKLFLSGKLQGASDKKVVTFVPEAVVAFRPRGSLRSFFKQYYLYARGDGKADLWRKRHAARYLTYLVALPLVLLLGTLIHPLLWLLVLPGGYVYMHQPYQRLEKLVSSDKLQVASNKTKNANKPLPQPSPAGEGGSKAQRQVTSDKTGNVDEPPPRSSPVNEGGGKAQNDKRYTIGVLVYLGVLIVVIRVVGDMAKMLGYPVGWIWRLRVHPPDWKLVRMSR